MPFFRLWTDLVGADRPQMTVWRMRIACWIPKATNTHSEYVILLFHFNNGYANTPQRYVIRPLPVVFRLHVLIGLDETITIMWLFFVFTVKLPDVRVQLKCDGTRWRRGGEVKWKLANGVGSHYSSHHLRTWCIQHYYHWCAHLGCH
jgi:hypothetical protein